MKADARHLGIGTWLSIGSPVIAEMASECGFEWLLLDLEHGCITESGVLACLQAAKREDIKLIVRVGSLDTALIAHVLDWGASGIMLPHVSTPGQAEMCVRAMQYPPHGSRGFSSSARAFKYGLNAPKNMLEWVPPLFLAQIENYDGVVNSEAIAAVGGVDMLFVGPADLKLALSFHSGEKQMSFDEALINVNQSAQIHGKQTGILVRNPQDIPALQQTGFTCLALGSDVSYLRDGFLGSLKGIKAEKSPASTKNELRS
ncbi:HpcH/HpaI aldolase/citrate lyase family protein [Dyadobacter sp. CY323]|uniref:HpcH/HpaI aldolase family protein n=1 Tax=Dyadobacter sp. CY323 TaxID=2907302 RepID=UPI001F2C506F|nr:aldolase/citrate lyase family protein [Dyadobacter sp. CY323]MCE6990505.1 aldolase/citrate lyase family protein [Dyadobacter sp. CY323]